MLEKSPDLGGGRPAALPPLEGNSLTRGDYSECRGPVELVHCESAITWICPHTRMAGLRVNQSHGLRGQHADAEPSRDNRAGRRHAAVNANAGRCRVGQGDDPRPATPRELALRAVADEVGEKAASRRQREGLEPALIPERVMVCMSSNTDAPRVLRTGARIAGRVGACWYAVYGETPREAPAQIKARDREALQKNFALAEQLGATVVPVRADRRADGLIAFARREGITHVIFGQSARSRLEILLKGPRSTASSKKSATRRSRSGRSTR